MILKVSDEDLPIAEETKQEFRRVVHQMERHERNTQNNFRPDTHLGSNLKESKRKIYQKEPDKPYFDQLSCGSSIQNVSNSHVEMASKALHKSPEGNRVSSRVNRLLERINSLSKTQDIN